MTHEPRNESDYSQRQTMAARRVLVDVGQAPPIHRVVSPRCHPAIPLATVILSCGMDVKDSTCRRYANAWVLSLTNQRIWACASCASLVRRLGITRRSAQP